MEKYRRIILIGIFLFAAVSAFAQGTPETREGKTDYVLSLEETTQLALKNNFDIQLAKYDTLISRTDKGVTESIFDTVIDAEIKYRDNQRKQSSSLAGTKSLDNDYNLGVSKRLSTGTTLSADWTNNRNWTNSSFVTLNPAHDSTLEFTVEQDLGKNFFGLKDRGDVKITQIDIENSRFTSLDKIESDLADVQKAYWDMVLHKERVNIEEDMVAQAKQLFDLHQEKLQHGLVETPDVLAAEVNYKERVNNLILVRNQMTTKENVLRLLLNITDDNVAIVPKDVFTLLSGNIEQLDFSLKTAFENRYDYKKARKVIKSRDIKVSIKKNNIWPEINLELSLARNGVDNHFNQAIEQITDEDNPNFFAGVSFNMPIENSKAKAELKASELEKAKSLISLKLLERKITIGIVDQVRLCNVLKQLAVNADAIADLQAKKLQAEQKRFSSGRSDTDTIIRFQEDLSRSRWSSAQAKFNYYAATIDLRQKEGTLLNTYWDGEI